MITPGKRFGTFEVIGSLGAGGMGEVYRARDTRLDRDVAFKVLPELFTSDPDRLARFEREAKVLASLNHPNIAAIYGLEESDGVRALVLVEGPTLADRIVQGPIGLEDALPIARQIAEALEAAHEHGIIHRDLKPANIKVRADGTVKVLDFGLAKAIGGDGSGPAGSAPSQSPTITSPAAMTGVGVLLGTAAYMSPEQAKGRAADKRSDVWAFGCVLYEMLTGTRAFEGDDVSDTLAAVLRGTPDWTALPVATPDPVRRLLRRSLEKDRKRRLSDIADARLEIDEALTTPASPGGEAAVAAVVAQRRPVWRRAVPVVVSAIVTGVLVATAVWNFKASAPLTVTRSRFILPEGQQFTNPNRQMVAVSPDGTHLVYAANQRLYLRSMSELEARPIPGSTQDVNVFLPVFSPDGQSIAFARPSGTGSADDSRINRIAVSGGPVVTIGQAALPTGMSWGTSGIVFDRGPNGIMRVAANGGAPELLVKVESDEVAAFPQMLPGNRAVLFTLATGAGADRWDKARIVAQSLRSGEPKTLVQGGSSARYVPTGHIVYAVAGTLFAVAFDERRLEVTGQAAPVVEGVRHSPATGAAQFSVSNTGSLVFIPGPASPTGDLRDLVLIDRKGGVERLKLPRGGYESPRISPNGRQVAFSTVDTKEAIVWIYDLSGTSARRRLTFGGRNRFPIWSADGQRVAFQSDRDGAPGIYWQRADGADTAERLTTPEPGTSHIPESWSPKGDRLSFSAITVSNASLWMVSLQDKKAAPFGEVRSSLPLNSAFSPDGRWVAYTFRSRETVNVFVEPFLVTGAKYQVSKDNGSRRPIWSPDGKALFYQTAEGLVVVSVSTQPSFTVGNPEALSVKGVSTSAGSPANHDITADGKRFIVVAPASGPDAGEPSEIQVVNWFEELKRLAPVK